MKFSWCPQYSELENLSSLLPVGAVNYVCGVDNQSRSHLDGSFRWHKIDKQVIKQNREVKENSNPSLPTDDT